MRTFTAFVFAAYLIACFAACCCPCGAISQSIDSAVKDAERAAEKDTKEAARSEVELETGGEAKPANPTIPNDLEVEKTEVDKPSEIDPIAKAKADANKPVPPKPTEPQKPEPPKIIGRKFTAGEFSVFATLIDAKEGVALLEKTNREQVTIDIEKLSDSDRQYIEFVGVEKSLFETAMAEYESQMETYRKQHEAYESALSRREEARQAIAAFEEEKRLKELSSVSRSDKIAAWVMAQDFVKKFLRAPSTADFGSVFGEYQDPQKCVKYLGSGRYQVRGWVDSQNAFGATIRSDFLIELQDKGDDRWGLVETPLIESR